MSPAYQVDDMATPEYLDVRADKSDSRSGMRTGPEPPDVVLHNADVAAEDRAWFSAVPITNPRRTLNDCAREGLSPELLRQAAQQALRRGLVTKPELGDVEEVLKPFGGLAA